MTIHPPSWAAWPRRHAGMPRCLLLAALLGFVAPWPVIGGVPPVEAPVPANWRLRRTPVESEKPLPPIALLVEQLGSPRFAERVQASRDLVRAGARGVDAVRDAADSDEPERSLRSVAVLEDIWLNALENDDDVTAAAAFDALDSLSQAEDPVLRTRVEATFAANEARVSKYSMDELARLGGWVKYSDGISIIDENGQMRPQVDIVFIDRKWKGGVEGLRHVRRIQPLVLYVIDGGNLPADAATAFGANNRIKVENRGRAYFGIRHNGLAPNVGGVAVEFVEPNQAAALGGIQPGDVITAFNGQPVQSFQALVEEIQKTSPGQTVVVKVRRGEMMLDLKVNMGAWPE